jgi:hypothetical protein
MKCIGQYRRGDIYAGESYRVIEAQSENKAEQKRLGRDLLTEFVQGGSKSGCVLLFQ